MYNKLFSKIVDSSVWMAPDHVRLVWMMFIAIMDEDGFVNLASVKNVAHRAVIDLEKAKFAIGVLEGPDPESSNPANEGRRLTRVPGGWIVNNAKEYREIVKREHQKELNRERVKKHRKNKENERCNGAVMPTNESVTPSYTEADVEADTNVNTIVQKPKTVFEPVHYSLVHLDENAVELTQAVKGLAGAKRGFFVKYPQDDKKDAGKGLGTQMQGKPEKPRKVKKAKTDGEPKINAWGIWIDVCREQRLKDPVAIGPDLKASKEVGKAIKDKARMEHVFRMFLQDRDPWLLEHGHALRNIGARINRYLNDSGGVGIPGEVWADDAEAEAIIEGRVETPF